MRFITLAVALLSYSAVASIEQAPPNFAYKKSEAVYVDFESAHYKLTYDLTKKKLTIESEIVFVMPTVGYPIYDLKATPSDQKIDGVKTTSQEVSDPDHASKFRVIDRIVEAGRHTLTVKHELTDGLSFKDVGVASAFWMSDLSDREYLEQYLPSNYEYDQVAMTMRVEVIGAAGKPHVLRANGAVTTLSENVFEVTFPKFYTTSSVFYHLLPVGAVPSTEFNFTSIDGRTIPVEVYTTSNLKAYADRAKEVLTELEKDYGAFPHQKVIIYGSGQGGMEYSGATVTSLSALGHELFHSYNARAVMPSQGNAGWIDEAMSSWRDADYTLRSSPSGTTIMAGHSKWTRMTDDDAYTRGRDFLAWIAGRMDSRGQNFKSFLREYFKNHFYTTMTTPEFQAEIEKYSGLDLKDDFDQYIYGTKGTPKRRGDTWPTNQTPRLKEAASAQALYHPQLSKTQLNTLLWP